MERVVVTGLGTINPLGSDVSSSWEAAKEGRNGIDFIERLDSENIGVHIAGEVKDFDFTSYFGRKQKKRLDRFVQFALKATDEAVKDADIDFETLDTTRIGVFYGSGIGGLETIAREEDKARQKGHHRISPFFIPMAIINLAAGNIAIRYNLKGKATASVTACASATNSIGDAFVAIRDGYLDAAVSGGSEASLTPLGLSGFRVMQALSRSDDPNTASKPFDKDRDGFVMGEGAATLMLESLSHARKRGAKIYAEITGYASTCDAHHITSPDEEGRGAYRCMQGAIEDARLLKTDIDYINAHGTSTPLNDKIESKAIKALFEDHAEKLSVSSNKSMVGHLLGASGALESLFTVLSLKEGVILPTINLKTPDPECALDFVPGSMRESPIKAAMTNSFGFGGHNASLIFEKWRDQE